MAWPPTVIVPVRVIVGLGVTRKVISLEPLAVSALITLTQELLLLIK